MAKKDESKNSEAQSEKTGGKNLVRKIVNKVLFSDKGSKPKMPEGESRMFLGNVFGIARSVKTGDSDYGPWTKLVGAFEAHTHDGRVMQSPQCILPEPMQGMIAEQLADENTESLQFSVNVYMQEADTATGYEYITETVIESDAADPLADLRAQSAKAITKQ